MSKRPVYFNEFNVQMGRLCYLPLVSGLLRAYAETVETVRTHYEFMPFLYRMTAPDEILRAYTTPPAVAAFSVSMWNEQLNLVVAAEVKRRWSTSLIVFGGPQVPHDPTDYMREHGFIDVAIRAEGEESFADVLARNVESNDFAGIPHVSFRRAGEIIVNPETRKHQRELDAYPSPYLEGLYDDLLAQRSDTMDFQAIIETNRGCPFECTFCYWGRGGLSRKYRYHDMDRVLAEIDWCGRNKIAYVFNADSNFGMHKRDGEIAEFIVATKQKYGFPDKFRTCFGKNTDEKIFRIGSLFHANKLEKGITLARQSNDPATLVNIKRANIKMETYESLQRRFNEEAVPVYSELILGLPGETAASWTRGIDDMLQSGLRNQLFTYLCQVFPNTELADQAYRERFGIVTRRVELNEIHGSVRDPSWVKEYEDIVIETASMPHADWRRMVVLSWSAMALHSMKLAFYVLAWLRDRFGVKASAFIEYLTEHAPAGTMWRRELYAYKWQIDDMIERGMGRGQLLPDYGAIYWDTEEATFLRVAEDWETFYDELAEIVAAFLRAQATDFDAADLRQVIGYQRSRMPTVSDFQGDKHRFARDTILWGRKSGTMLRPEGAGERAA